MPAATVQRVQTALRDTLQAPDVRKRLEDAGATVAEPGVDLGAYQKQERDKYARIVKFASIQE